MLYLVDKKLFNKYKCMRYFAVSKILNVLWEGTFMTLPETIKCSSSVLPFPSPFPSSVLKPVSGTEKVGCPVFGGRGGLEQGVGT